MRRLLASIAVCGLIVSGPGFVEPTFAHGASCMSPPHYAPPEGSDPPPPPPPTSTPIDMGGNGDGSGDPTAGGGRGSGPSTGGGGGGGPTTGGGGGAGPTTGGGASGGLTGKARPKGVGGESWTKWWECNKYELLPLKSSVREMQRGPRSRGLGGDVGRTPTDAAIQKRIVPLLKSLLADPAQSYHVRSAAEIALAKIGDVESAPMLELCALNVSKSLHREVEETGALALGVMREDGAEAREVLVGLACGAPRGNTFVRPFAAAALGMIGTKNDPERVVARSLLGVVARKESGADIKPACFLALGLLGDETLVPELLAIVRNGQASATGAVPLSDVETAYAVAALGKIGRPGTDKPGEETRVVDEMLRLVDVRTYVAADVRRSAVVALGQIGPACPPSSLRSVVGALESTATNAVDGQERYFAAIALGRIGGAKGADAATRQRIGKFLVRQLDAKGRGQTPAYAALALGLVGRGIVDEGGAAPEEDVRAPLRAKFGEGGDPELRGAFALASGLVRDPLAADALLSALADRGADKRVRGWSALALGLIGVREAAATVRATLKDETDRELRFQAATAAGLLRDPGAMDDVLALLDERDASNYELGSALLALGQIGDERAVEALLAVVTDAKGRWRPETRSVAVVALGRIGDKRDLPALARVAADVNYRTNVPAIEELLSIL